MPRSAEAQPWFRRSVFVTRARRAPLPLHWRVGGRASGARLRRRARAGAAPPTQSTHRACCCASSRAACAHNRDPTARSPRGRFGFAAKDTHACRGNGGLVHVCHSQQRVSSGSSRSWPLYTRTLLHISSMVPRHGVRRSSCSWRLPHTLLLNKTSRSQRSRSSRSLLHSHPISTPFFHFSISLTLFRGNFPLAKTRQSTCILRQLHHGLVPPLPLMGDSKLRYSKKGRFRQWRVYWLTV